MLWPRSLLGFAAVDVIAYRRKSKPALVAAWISDHQGTKLRAAFGRLFLRAVYWEAAVLPLNYARGRLAHLIGRDRAIRQAPWRLAPPALGRTPNLRCVRSLRCYDRARAGGVMAGRGYTIFDTAIGRCGIAWGNSGIVGVQLPEAREIETRRRLFRLYPEARELRPPLNVEMAIEGIVALLRGEPADLSEVILDMTGIPAFNARVYAFTRTIPRGETRSYGEVATNLRASGAVHSVAQAISRNPFMIIVPCHRVLEAGGYADKISPHGGTISKRRLLSIEGANASASKTLFDVLLPVAPPRPQG